MNVLDLFAGIGGFTLGLERAGFTTVAFCEIDSYAQKVLKKNWPGVPIYDDVRQITAARLISDGIRVDVITGGFPCQDLSLAGNQAGIEGERSGLWSECARLLGEVRPRYAIFENVPNLLNGGDGNWFKRVLWDISKVGYDAEWHCIRASDIGAPHRRERIWIICYKNNSSMADTQSVQNNGLRFNENQGQAKTNRIQSGGSGSGTVGVGDTAHGGSQGSGATRVGQGVEQSGSQFGGAISDVGVDNAIGNGRNEGRFGDHGRNDGQQPDPVIEDGRAKQTNGAWSDVDWLLCRDGKWRPVEPNTFPLADGATARVGRLRAYGNAITAQVAQGLIESYMEVRA